MSRLKPLRYALRKICLRRTGSTSLCTRQVSALIILHNANGSPQNSHAPCGGVLLPARELFCALRAKHGRKCCDQNIQVEPKGAVLDIETILRALDVEVAIAAR